MPIRMCVARLDWPKEWQHYVKALVLVVGVLYTVYSFYYACLRLGSRPKHTDSANVKLPEAMFLGDETLKSIHDYVTKEDLPPDVTVITAYFNIGIFKKGSLFRYTPTMYIHWMRVFSKLANPLIMFTDSKDVHDLFLKLRQNFSSNQSKIIMVDRTELWSFSLTKEIGTIFHQPNYPVFQPNTVNENYSCVMHAKFELVNRVIKEKLYKTRYLSWLDIGLFRDVASKGMQFPIQIPPAWDQNKVAFSEVFEFNPTLSPREVILGNHVWVGGAMFLGRPEILYLFTQDYKDAVKRLLSQRLMNTDQQVVYSMYLPAFNFKARVLLQTYTTRSHNDWFYLGYMIKELWDRKRREVAPLVRFLLLYL